ncbi:hypothetical protein SDC9_131921 [bioreactor metagenome]|uniref:Uncharacterized protein n=1 Tax=bioreactor metagenome TaxID=1076179 RepID=A0A645D6L9_9ZZZZ
MLRGIWGKLLRILGLRSEDIAYEPEGTRQKLKTNIPAVFLCMKSKDTPILAKVLAGVQEYHTIKWPYHKQESGFVCSLVVLGKS